MKWAQIREIRGARGLKMQVFEFRNENGLKFVK